MGATTFDVTTRALVMGILNRTKDSFYEPAATYDLDALFTRAEQLVRDGADLLDIGGESSRPGHVEIDEAEEVRRVVPVIAAIHAALPEIPLSVDTWRPAVAAAIMMNWVRSRGARG